MKEFEGKIIKSISGCEIDSDRIIISFEDGSDIKMYHEQDCCESVYVENVQGEPSKHIGAIFYSIDEKSN
ncbi:MAG TPA: hypothetical protein VFM18_06995, partial [Methanosarcina sp.]|nr:hypothetical protein [Methanosarcina sp.]